MTACVSVATATAKIMTEEHQGRPAGSRGPTLTPAGGSQLARIRSTSLDQ
jgi:hypothetical protein